MDLLFRKDSAAPSVSTGSGDRALASIALALGVALSIIGWTDLALLWYPLNFSSAEWEFSTISSHFDGMPLGAIGLVLLGAAAVGYRSARALRAITVIYALLALVLTGMLVVYSLDSVMAWRAVNPQIQGAMHRAILKAFLFALTYIGLFGWLTRRTVLWRRALVAGQVLS